MAVTSVLGRRRERLSLGRLVTRRVRLTVLALLVCAALAVLAAVVFDRAYAGRVLPGVSVSGLDVSGLTAAELHARLDALSPLPERVEIVSGERSVTIDAAVLGQRVDVDGAVAAALAAGRAAGPLGDLPERFSMWRDGRDIELAVSVDRPTLVAWVAARADALAKMPVNARIVRTATGWSFTDSSTGRRLAEAETVRAIQGALLTRTAVTAHVEAPLIVTEPAHDDLDAILAIAGAERMAAGVRLTLDDKVWAIAPATIQAAIGFVNGSEGPVALLDRSKVVPALAPIAKDVARKPSQTLFLKTKRGDIFGFVSGRDGRALDTAATTDLIARLLDDRRTGIVTAAAPVELALMALAPETSADEAAKVAPRMTRIGAWTTNFSPGIRNHNGANIRIPATLINGTVVQPGQVFDFWQAVGPVTFERGFGMGAIIQGGRSNPTGAIGGGICSASTTLFNAAARGGYEILERDNHAYYIPRYPLGLDATVSKTKGGVQNMRFRNDTPNPIYIRGLSGSTWVRFEIYSLPTGRTVTFSRPSVSNVREAIDTVVRTSTLKAGTKIRDETPADGKDVVVTRTVQDASGRVIRRDRWFSHYIRVDGVVRIGTG